MDLFRLAQLPTVVALGHRSSFFLDLKQGALGVLARRGAVALDACLADEDVSAALVATTVVFVLTRRISCR